MVGQEVEVVAHEAGHPLAQPARQAAVLTAPEQPVVDQQRVGPGLDGRVDESQAGGDPRDEAAHLAATLDLQAVRPIIPESVRRQQRAQAGLEFACFDHLADPSHVA